MAEQSLSQLFTNTGTFGLPKIELDVQNEIRSGSSAKDVAAYLSDNSGLNYDALIEDFNDDTRRNSLLHNQIADKIEGKI